MATHNEFVNKYRKHRDYHWRWYGNKQSYTEYVDFVRGWITEKSVLDVGAGDGLICSLIGARGIDNNECAVEAAAQHGVRVDLGDAANMPYRDEEFEAAFIGNTLEHLVEPHAVLTECYRVVTSSLYIIVPLIERPFKTSESRLKTMVESHGFALEGQMLRERGCLKAKFRKIK